MAETVAEGAVAAVKEEAVVKAVALTEKEDVVARFLCLHLYPA